MARHFDAGRDIIAAKLVRERANHRKVNPPSRRRRRSPAAAAGHFKVAGVGGDRVAVQVGDRGRPAELNSQPVAEGAVDRRVLSPRRRHRRPRREPLGHFEQVALLEPLPHSARVLARGPAREKLLLGEDLDMGHNLTVDPELQLRTRTNQRPIFEPRHLG